MDFSIGAVASRLGKRRFAVVSTASSAGSGDGGRRGRLSFLSPATPGPTAPTQAQTGPYVQTETFRGRTESILRFSRSRNRCRGYQLSQAGVRDVFVSSKLMIPARRVLYCFNFRLIPTLIMQITRSSKQLGRSTQPCAVAKRSNVGPPLSHVRSGPDTQGKEEG